MILPYLAFFMNGITDSVTFAKPLRLTWKVKFQSSSVSFCLLSQFGAATIPALFIRMSIFPN